MSSLPSNSVISESSISRAGPIRYLDNSYDSRNLRIGQMGYQGQHGQSHNASSNVLGLSSEHISTNVVVDVPQPNIVQRAVRNIRRRHTISSIQKEQKEALPASQRITYRDRYVIVPDEELSIVGEKKCLKYDKYNEAIWKRNLDHFHRMQRVHSKRAHSAIKIENPLEDLPQSSNYERFIIHQQRHQPTDCLEQTSAILYLCSHSDYQLVDDLGSIEVQRMQESRPRVIFFESHQAIELARARVQATGDEDFTTIIYKLRSGFTIDPSPTPASINNISANTNSTRTSTSSSFNNTHDILPNYVAIDIVPSQSNANPNTETIKWTLTDPFEAWTDKTRKTATPNTNTQNTQNTNNTDMRCCVPEHHRISDKVEHFDNLASNTDSDGK